MINLAAQSVGQSITARQGAGMTQLSPNEIVIVGGFNGKFLSDYYLLQFNDQGAAVSVTKQENERSMIQGATLFPFQVPTIGDIKNRQAYTVDWQNMSLFFYNGQKWTYNKHVKHQANF
jgi:hypothetical protein